MLSNKYYRLVLRITAAFFVTMLVFFIGILTIRYQISHDLQQRKLLSAQSAVTQIDIILQEAEDASKRARIWLLYACTADVRNNLNQLAIAFSHLRVISLLHGEILICSSYSASSMRTVDLSNYAEGRLSLRKGSVITPDSPLLILLTKFKEGTVSASIGVPHITEILSSLSIHGSLNLLIGSYELSPKGIIKSKTNGRNEIVAYSTLFPYSVKFAKTTTLSLIDVFVLGRELVFLLSVISILAGWLTSKAVLQETSPYIQLTRAIESNQITPWYQPIVSTNGEVHGVEVLARWKDAKGKYISPDDFIPLAEKFDLIMPLTRMLMLQTAKELSQIIERFPKSFHVGFNISAAHLEFRHKALDDFRNFQSFFPAGSIQMVIEITERQPFEKQPFLKEFIYDLQNQNIKIALDDFGTGYSNLGYLNNFPIDYIKLDRSFISKITEKGEDSKLVESVINMVRSLDIELIAEGIETEYQASWLKNHTVTFLQGYLYSPPMPIQKFIRMVVLQYWKLK